MAMNSSAVSFTSPMILTYAKSGAIVPQKRSRQEDSSSLLEKQTDKPKKRTPRLVQDEDPDDGGDEDPDDEGDDGSDDGGDDGSDNGWDDGPDDGGDDGSDYEAASSSSDSDESAKEREDSPPSDATPSSSESSSSSSESEDSDAAPHNQPHPPGHLLKNGNPVDGSNDSEHFYLRCAAVSTLASGKLVIVSTL